MIVPFPPGGGNDTMARIVAAKLSAALGQQVVVDNRGGANGVIAMRTAARATPDGYTIVFANTSSTSINLALNPNAGYDIKKEFAPIGMFASAGIGIIAHPNFPPNTVAELIDSPEGQSRQDLDRHLAAWQRLASVGRIVQGEDRRERDAMCRTRARLHSTTICSAVISLRCSAWSRPRSAPSRPASSRCWR